MMPALIGKIRHLRLMRPARYMPRGVFCCVLTRFYRKDFMTLCIITFAKKGPPVRTDGALF
jgi:hypothetical protein